MWADGRAHHGMWKDGSQNGEGTKVKANMEMTKSFWLNGKSQNELELSDAERTDIALYITNMHNERSAIISKQRTSTTQRSRNFERQKAR